MIKSVSESEVHYSELMIPTYSNFGGKVHGGIILSIMDKVAYICASKHSSSYVVTVAVEGVEFLSPVEVGEVLEVSASVNYVGRSSMIIGMSLEAYNPITHTRKSTNSCFFTMVAKNVDGSPKEVPGLKISSKEELIRFCEGKWIRDTSKLKRSVLETDLNGASESDLRMMCLNENCIVSF